MRVIWPRVSCWTGLLLIAGGWILTVFLSILIIDHQQQEKVILQVQEPLGLERPPCDCPCAKGTASAPGEEPEREVSPQAHGSQGQAAPHPPAANEVKRENGTSGVRIPGQQRVDKQQLENEQNSTYWKLLSEYKEHVSEFIQKKSDNHVRTNLQNGVPTAFIQPGSYDRIWPIPNETDDRVLAQVNLVPKLRNNTVKIAMLGKFSDIENGNKMFIKDKCPVQKCEIIGANPIRADVIVFKRDTINPWVGKLKPKQIVVWYSLESPLNTPALQHDVINWTATYRRDSTINAPYEKFTPYKTRTFPLQRNKDYASGKAKMAAWFVSNCQTQNGRAEYVKELQKYIKVDVYGSCGPLKCPRRSKHCEKMLSRDYKFYLAFENSNCVNYITEKFFWNALLNDVVPVVMGARPEDYAAVAPHHSYIHVDDFESPRDLADYLRMLNSDHQKYNEYFRWKGTGEFINTKFWCRLCSLAHEAATTDTRLHYRDFQKWWSGKAGQGVCQKAENKTSWASWRDKPRDYRFVDHDTVQYLS